MSRLMADDPLAVPVEERWVRVGGSRYDCNPAEWVAVNTHHGDRVIVQEGHRRPFVLVVTSTYFYDGIHLHGYEPDPDERYERTVFCDSFHEPVTVLPWSPEVEKRMRTIHALAALGGSDA